MRIINIVRKWDVGENSIGKKRTPSGKTRQGLSVVEKEKTNGNALSRQQWPAPTTHTNTPSSNSPLWSISLSNWPLIDG